jgi:hypothetical protein
MLWLESVLTGGLAVVAHGLLNTGRLTLKTKLWTYMLMMSLNYARLSKKIELITEII